MNKKAIETPRQELNRLAYQLGFKAVEVKGIVFKPLNQSDECDNEIFSIPDALEYVRQKIKNKPR